MELTTINPETADVHKSAWRDWLGITASIGCAIHCAAMPFVVAYLPVLGLSFLADESFHKWMALICFLIAIVAFIPGIRKHGNWIPVSIAAIALVLITYAAFGLAGECCAGCEATTSNSVNTTAVVNAGSATDCDGCNECDSCDNNNQKTVATTPSKRVEQQDWLAKLAPWITPIGGVLLVSAHLINRRCGFLCGCC